MNNFRSRRDGRNSRRFAHFHIVQRQHESWWMDFLSQINHAFNSSDFKIPYFIAQWSHKNSWNQFWHFIPTMILRFFLQTISFFKSVPWNWLMVNNKISYEFKKFLAPFLISKFHTLSHENSRASKVHMYS